MSRTRLYLVAGKTKLAIVDRREIAEAGYRLAFVVGHGVPLNPGETPEDDDQLYRIEYEGDDGEMVSMSVVRDTTGRFRVPKQKKTKLKKKREKRKVKPGATTPLVEKVYRAELKKIKMCSN
jgi:hypothetical protein